MAEASTRVERFQRAYATGNITNGERYNKVIDTWTHANNDIADAMVKRMRESQGGFNPVFMMFDSGARGRATRSVSSPVCAPDGEAAEEAHGGIGEIIESPIRSNFREGLSVLEYFISTHGARKGLADTALRTADSGYLTRRLVDVSQDVIIREVDCGTDRGLPVTIAEPGEGGMRLVDNLDTSVASRVLARDVEADGKVVVPAGTVLDMPPWPASPRLASATFGALGAHLREQGRHVRHVLRRLARHRQAGRRGRGHRHHRGPVDR